MDNAIVVDGVLAVVLIAGAVIGAKRGLFKTLMGFVAIVAALIGAVLLADALTPPITDAIAPKIEASLVETFADALDKKEEEAVDSERGKLSERLEKYGVEGEALQKLLAPLTTGAHDAAETAKERAVDAFRDAISSAVYSLVRGTVHAVLVLILYIVLLFALRLLTGALDLVFDLPVLNTLNGAGGAILGFLEAALLLYVVVYAASQLGVKAITEHAGDTFLLPVFLNHSPVELISSFARKG